MSERSTGTAPPSATTAGPSYRSRSPGTPPYSLWRRRKGSPCTRSAAVGEDAPPGRFGGTYPNQRINVADPGPVPSHSSCGRRFEHPLEDHSFRVPKRAFPPPRLPLGREHGPDCPACGRNARARQLRSLPRHRREHHGCRRTPGAGGSDAGTILQRGAAPGGRSGPAADGNSDLRRGRTPVAPTGPRSPSHACSPAAGTARRRRSVPPRLTGMDIVPTRHKSSIWPDPSPEASRTREPPATRSRALVT